MESFFGLLLFLVFILLPLIEQIRKQGKQQPPQRRPPVRPPAERPRSSTEEISSKPREPASVMIPDDLWQILTGEKRPPTLPEPTAPPPREQKPWDVVYIPPEETEDEEEEFVEDVNVEVARTTSEAVRREHAQRHLPGAPVSLETEPVIVSLESAAPSGPARHAAFHQKIAPLPRAEAPKRRSALGLNKLSELQRAFILQEVLGRPRGLD